ncbi:MAG TPA: hypothetical protein VMX79_11865 [bacterium]|nr:hypothetical protein [bacterium]
MRKGYVLIAAIAVGALAVSAFGWGSVVSSFYCPAGSTLPNGVGWERLFTSNDYLWVATNLPDRCYRVTYSGSIQRSHTLPGSATRDCDGAYIAPRGYYFLQDYGFRRMYQIGYDSGSIYRSYVVPYTTPYGVAFRAVGSTYYLYGTSTGNRRIYRMNATTGSVYASYSVPFEPRGIGYGDGYLWIADGTYRRIRKCSVTGSTYDWFSVSAYGTIGGLDYDYVNNYVWAGFDASRDRVYRFETRGGSAVTPSSMGKIKATFK